MSSVNPVSIMIASSHKTNLIACLFRLNYILSWLWKTQIYNWMFITRFQFVFYQICYIYYNWCIFTLKGCKVSVWDLELLFPPLPFYKCYLWLSLIRSQSKDLIDNKILREWSSSFKVNEPKMLRKCLLSWSKFLIPYGWMFIV